LQYPEAAPIEALLPKLQANSVAKESKTSAEAEMIAARSAAAELHPSLNLAPFQVTVMLRCWLSVRLSFVVIFFAGCAFSFELFLCSTWQFFLRNATQHPWQQLFLNTQLLIATLDA
jgi:hypothetical protein